MTLSGDTQRLTTVLIVEDDPLTRARYRNVLRSAGFHVTTAYNGVHAMKVMQQRPLPDIIVLGVGPPLSSGLDFYDELPAHADAHLIPVVVVTRIDLSPQQQARFPFLLHEPVVPSALVFAVDNALRRSLGRPR